MHLQRFWALCGLLAALVSAPTLAFDHDYGDYGALLTEHVQLSDDRTRGSVDYAGLQQNRARLDALLEDWSAVSQKTLMAGRATSRWPFSSTPTTASPWR